MKLGKRDSHITNLTDKAYAKEFIKGKTRIKPIPETDAFPCIAKPNNSSGKTRLINNQKEWDSYYRKWLKFKDEKYGYEKGEWNYWGIEPKLLKEAVLKDFREAKYMCFHGKVEVIQLMGGGMRPETGGVSYFNPEFINVRNVKWPNCEKELPEIMKEYISDVEILAEGLDFVRVDLIFAKDVYFGEYSFFIGGGHTNYDPPEFDEYLGGLL